MPGQLADKTVLVTGGAAGIGRATSILCAREGARVAVADRDQTGGERVCAEIRAAGGSASFIASDMADPASISRMIASAADTLGRIHCAVNNAGVADEARSMMDSSRENWDRIMSINLQAVWLCMREEIGHMLERGGGTIVNMSSRAGLVGVPTDAVYGAAKHGVVGLTKSAAVEFASRAIRVNSVCPGTILTPLVEARFKGTLSELAKTTNPMQRIADPFEVAHAIVWLLSDNASFVTGVALPVDGGATAR